MKIIFIGDAHLKGPEDPNQKALVEFLETLRETDCLVILGDLFDFWTGYNRFLYDKFFPVLNAFRRLRGRGTRIIYIEGNHDFTMGTFFTETLGAEVHRDSYLLQAGADKIFLAHGDTVGMTTGYRLWRGFLRTPLFRLIIKLTPPRFVWRVAMRLSGRSRNYSDSRGRSIEKEFMAFARQEIGTGGGGGGAVVLGHSHVAGVHAIEAGERTGTYANPGSWLDRSYLVYNDGKFSVESFG